MAQFVNRLGVGHNFFKSCPTPEKLLDRICIEMRTCWQMDVGANTMLVQVYDQDVFIGSISFVGIGNEPATVLAVDVTGGHILTQIIERFMKERWG